MSIDLSRLSAPFSPDKIHWRVGATTKDKKKGMALAYIDARDVMERLDEVCGPEGWQRRYVDAGNGRTCCEVGVNIQAGMATCDGDNNFTILEQWVWKSDGAGDTDVEGDKGAFSDAFKRAAVNWGIGRYLYDLPSVWVELEARGNSYVIKQSEIARLQRGLGASAPTQSSAADVYVEAALKVIGTMQNIDGLYQWWEDEHEHRASNGLTKEHVKTLKEANVKRRDELEKAAA